MHTTGNVSFARIFHKLVRLQLYLANWYEFILFDMALTEKLSTQGKVICAYVLDNQRQSATIKKKDVRRNSSKERGTDRQTTKWQYNR